MLDAMTASLIATEIAFAKAALQAARKLAEDANSPRLTADDPRRPGVAAVARRQPDRQRRDEVGGDLEGSHAAASRAASSGEVSPRK
jgi:hypothetical protein